MYAVIRAGGKQHKVSKGDVIEIERVKDGSETVEFTPLLVVDDKGKTRSGPSELAKARVTAKVLGETKGPKVDVMKFRNKAFGGQEVRAGAIIVRQRGTRLHPGLNVKRGNDDTLYAVAEGTVKFHNLRGRRVVSVV